MKAIDLVTSDQWLVISDQEAFDCCVSTREALIKSPSEFLKSPMVQDEEEFPANTEVFKGGVRRSIAPLGQKFRWKAI